MVSVSESELARILSGLHENWTPHSGQIPIGYDLFYGGKKNIFVCAGRNFGKAMGLDTKIITKRGWTVLGDIKDGDYVKAIDGTWTRVLRAHEVLYNQDVYEVEFSTGEIFKCCGNHRWEVSLKVDRKHKYRENIRHVIKTKDLTKLKQVKEWNYRVDLAEPLSFERTQQPLKPYCLGYWLGNGNSHDGRVSSSDIEAMDNLGYAYNFYSKYDYGVYGIIGLLRGLNVLKNKHIPDNYLYSAVDQRLELLRGLMDSDGTVAKHSGSAQFDNTNELLANQVLELVSSLGERATIIRSPSYLNGVRHKDHFTVQWTPRHFNPFFIKRKANLIRFATKKPMRTIVRVEKIKSEPVRCLTVEHERHLFLVGKTFVPTHNSEMAAYCTWRYAMQYPGSQNYIFEPLAKQAREILWASNRIQTFGPQEWIESINITEMRVTFTNGSFIKLEGSDNSAAMAGIKPKGLIIYDELSDHRLNSIQNFEPNRAAHDVPALFIGTPPIVHNHFIDYMELAKNNEEWSFYHAPTSANPHIKASWLDKKKAEMVQMGMLEDYVRSYEAVFVKGGRNSIFPWIHKASFPKWEDVKPKDLNKWTIIVGLDPAATSVFGVVFAAFSPWNKQLIVFDEIYESEPAEMTSRKMYEKIKDKLAPYRGRVHDIEYVYDSAAAYFRSELNEIDQSWWLVPSQKERWGIEGYINLLRAYMGKDLLTICDSCPKLIHEMESYIKDDDGKIPKGGEHAINALQYLIASQIPNLEELMEVKPLDIMERRAFRITEELDDYPYSEI